MSVKPVGGRMEPVRDTSAAASFYTALAGKKLVSL